MIAVLLADHVARATPLEALFYAGAVALWLVGVAVVVYRKARPIP